MESFNKIKGKLTFRDCLDISDLLTAKGHTHKQKMMYVHKLNRLAMSIPFDKVFNKLSKHDGNWILLPDTTGPELAKMRIIIKNV